MFIDIERSADSGGVRLSVKRLENRLDMIIKTEFDPSVKRMGIGVSIRETYPEETVRITGAGEACLNTFELFEYYVWFNRAYWPPPLYRQFAVPIQLLIESPASLKANLFYLLKIITIEILLLGEWLFLSSSIAVILAISVGYLRQRKNSAV